MSRWKLTREQLIALSPCEEGLALFDALATRGLFATNKPERIEATASRSPEYAAWIEDVLPTKEGARSGSGDGSGDGYGYGSGSGDGYGYGSGSGDGDGDGYGYGYGAGSGYGYGAGSGSGDGNWMLAGARIPETEVNT